MLTPCCAPAVLSSFVVTAATEKREPHSAVDGGKLPPGEHYQAITRAMMDVLLAKFPFTIIREHPAHGDIYALALK